MSLNDQEVARSIPLRPLAEVAEVLGIGVDQLEMYGDTKAKIKNRHARHAVRSGAG